MNSLEEKEINWVFEKQTETAQDPLAVQIKVEACLSELEMNNSVECVGTGIGADGRCVASGYFSSLYQAMTGVEDEESSGLVDDWQSGCRCRTCNNVFPNMVNLYGHGCLVSSSSNAGGNRKVYVYLCKICGKFFTGQALLKEHLLRHCSLTNAANRRQDTCFKLLQYRRKHIRFCVFKCRRDASSDQMRRRSCNLCQEVVVLSQKNAVTFDRCIRKLVSLSRDTCYICNAVIVCRTQRCIELLHHSPADVIVNQICKFCNKSYNASWHLRMHDDQSLYYCHF